MPPVPQHIRSSGRNDWHPSAKHSALTGETMSNVAQRPPRPRRPRSMIRRPPTPRKRWRSHPNTEVTEKRWHASGWAVAVAATVARSPQQPASNTGFTTARQTPAPTFYSETRNSAHSIGMSSSRRPRGPLPYISSLYKEWSCTSDRPIQRTPPPSGTRFLLKQGGLRHRVRNETVP
jgi:hypothetical protein